MNDVEDTGVLWATIANAIPATYWTLLYLLKSKSITQIKKEVIENLNIDNGFDKEGLGKCVLLHSAIQETLRLISGSMIMREALEDVDLELTSGLVRIPRGSRVVCYPALAHNDSRIFENANEFRVDRFLTPTKDFYPFGMGESLCPGRFWAVNEIKMFIALVLQKMDLEVVGDCVLPEFDWSRVGLGVYPPVSDNVKVEYKFR